MADKKSGGPMGGDSGSPSKGSAPNSSSRNEGDQFLSPRDHKILENAIRGRVSRLVTSGQPKFSTTAAAGETPAELDLRLHPELDPVARQLPGTDKAIEFRDSFMKALTDPDPRRNRDMLAELQRAGIPMHTLAIHLFAPVAARIGNLWCDDEADFMQVSVASMRLGMMINHLSNHSSRTVQTHEGERRVLLARTPGAMHTIGVAVVAACFRDMGWLVDGGMELEVDDALYTRLSSAPYHLLGISVGKIDELRICSQAIDRVHTNPRTRNTKVALGGPAVLMYPDAFSTIGADIVARTPLEVIHYADRLAR